MSFDRKASISTLLSMCVRRENLCFPPLKCFQILSHVAQILFGEVSPNQFRWINPDAAAVTPAAVSSAAAAAAASAAASSARP
jgi:hypothetical protein